MIAFQLAGRATRDALWLSTFPLATLPWIVIASSAVAAVVCILVSRRLARVGPGRLVPALFVLSATLLLGEWWLAVVARPAAAIVLYLHFGALGALLISGFWALVGERFDPRTARRVVSRILLGATVGGLIGGLVPARVGSLTAMFPILAALHVVSALLVLGLRPAVARASAHAAEPPMSAHRAFRASPYLRGLVLLVVLTAMAEGLLDYVFKLRVTAAGTNGEALLRLFAGFYTVTALASIALQVVVVRPALMRLGVAKSAALCRRACRSARSGDWSSRGSCRCCSRAAAKSCCAARCSREPTSSCSRRWARPNGARPSCWSTSARRAWATRPAGWSSRPRSCSRRGRQDRGCWRA
jgi:hypothetical protein